MTPGVVMMCCVVRGVGGAAPHRARDVECNEVWPSSTGNYPTQLGAKKVWLLIITYASQIYHDSTDHRRHHYAYSIL